MSRNVAQRLVIVGLVLLFGALCARDSRATILSDKEKAKAEDCRKFVQQFYGWYADADFETWGVSESLDDVLDKKLLDIDLADQLNDVIDAETKHDEVWLEFDPVLNSKRPKDNYVAGAVTRKGERYLVDVYSSPHGRRNDKPDVVAELEFQIGRWTFVNFHYPNRAASPATENLLSVLNGIRKAHPVKAHAHRSDEPAAVNRQTTNNDPTIS